MNLKTTLAKTTLALAGTALCLLPLTVIAAPAKAAHAAPIKRAAAIIKRAAAMYECTKCHMKVNAATAKKDHYKDSMDGGTLVPVKTAKK